MGICWSCFQWHYAYTTYVRQSVQQACHLQRQYFTSCFNYPLFTSTIPDLAPAPTPSNLIPPGEPPQLVYRILKRAWVF